MVNHSSARRASTHILGFIAAALLPLLAPAATLYWDSNGTTNGAGTTPGGTWGTDAFWNTISGGGSGGTIANTNTTALDTLIFSAGTDATGGYTVTVNGTQNAKLLNIEEGAPNFSGGTIVLGTGGGITVAGGAGNPVLSSHLTISGAQTFNVGTGRTLTLNTGTFTRNAGAALNVQGAGTVTSTMTGLSTNNAVGIIGTWASFGSGTSTRYATFSGGDIVGFTGTAAATAVNLTDTTGMVNYDLSNATGTLQATVSANTLRYTGSNATTTLGAAFSVNGLLNAGTGTWTLASNTLTIGADRELVVNAANNAITINSVIADNGGGASALTKTGGNTLTLRGANTYSGATYLNQGTLNANSSAALGDGSAGNTLVFNGGTLQAGQSFDSAATRGITLLTTGVVDTNSAVLTLGGVISGAGGLSKTGSGTLILTGVNDYTGVTTISAGTLSVATIGDGGVAGNLGAAGSLAANLVFSSNATLQYTGVSASTDRSFTLSGSSYIEVTDSATNLTFTGGSTGGGSLFKSGAGTLTFAGGNSATGATYVYGGTLVLDYTASNGGKLADSAGLVLYNATLQLDRTSGASGSHVEVVSSTTLYGGAYITRGSGSSAVLRMNNISRNTGSTVDFSAVGIADTDTTNINGLLGNGRGWATIGGTDWAVNSTNGADGLIAAYSAYTDVTRQSSGSKVIADGSTSNVRIVEGTGGAEASLTLGAATTTINTLNQSASGGTGAALIDLAGQILGGNAILVAGGSGALTIGTADANRGTLRAAVSNGELILQNFGGNGLTINAGIVNNNSTSTLTHAGAGTTVLTGTNSYTGATNIVGGMLEVSGGGRITATNAITLEGGALRVDGTTASSVTSTGSLIAGNYAAGTLTITSGGTVSNATGFIGYNAGSMGVATVSGAGSTWTNTGNLLVGDRGIGTLSISNGGTVSNNYGYVGSSAGSTGAVTVSGAGSTWSNSIHFYVGNAGTGTLSITSGGRVSNAYGYIGTNAGSTGTATVSGAGSAWTSSDLQVGSSGVGTLSITSGGVVTSGNSFIGQGSGATGVVTVGGVGSTWTNSNFYVGYVGAGTLNISGGGAVSSAAGFIGQSSGSTGAVTVSGAGSTWTSSGALSVGNSGVGTLSITNGGWVSASALDGGSAGSSVNLDGGTLRITGTDSASNSINLLAGGGTLEVTTSGTTFTLTTGLSGLGALTKTGAGTLTLTGAHAYAGTTTIAVGTLQLGNGSTDGTLSGSTAIAVNGGMLSFNNATAQSFGGLITNSGVVTKTGAGSLTLSGTFTRNAGAVLNVQGGVVTSTMMGLTANNAAGIIGTWASFGNGTSIRYATFSGGDIVGLTGTAAATAANLTDTTGLVNYDLANAAGTVQATVSANTLRYTGSNATTTLGAAFSVNGLLNAGSTWTLASNTLTIGVDRELVVNAANNAITINSVIADNGGGASALTKTGGNTVTLRGANTYSGATYLKQGALNVNSSAALGDGSAGNTLVFNGGTLQAGQSFTSAATRGITLVTTGVVDTNGAVLTLGGVISGAGGLSKTGSGTLVLSGANDYTGVTTVSAGTLSVATIGDGGVAGNLGAASSAAANLVLSNGTLQYTGVSASTDRSFTLSGSSYIEVTESATNLTLTGGSTGVGNLIKSGAGTLTLAGGNSATGLTYVFGGTLVLDYTASNGGKLADTNSLALYSATLQLDRSGGASGSHVEVVSGTSLVGGAFLTRGSGSSAVLRMNGISRGTGSTVDFSAGGIADTDTTNTNDILGNGWATIGGTDWAVNSTNAADGLISAYSAYTDVTRQSSGSKVIADGATSNVRIVEGTGGAAASLTLGAATTTINTLNQSASGGTDAALIDLAGQTLGVKSILVAGGSGTLTIGTADASRGTLRAAVSNGELILQNFGSNGLTINASIVNFSGANGLTHAGTGTTVLTGTNTYTGATNVVGGTLEVSGGGRITATSGVTLDGGALKVDGTTASNVASTGSLIAGHVAAGTLSISSGGTVSNATGTLGNNAGSMGTATVSGAGSTWSNSGHLFVGSGGTGTLSITSGGRVSNNFGYLGNSAGSAGAVTVSGAGSTWSNSGHLFVGSGGTGTLSITGGGRVSDAYGYLGNGAGTTGTATVSGDGSIWTSNNDLYVGGSGAGTLSITSGGAVTSGVGHIAGSVGSTGTATVSGVGSTWTNGGFNVGVSGVGELSITNGGTVWSSTSLIGQNAGSTGAVTVSGAGSTWTSSNFYVGNLGVGTLSISGGGAVSSNSGSIGSSAGATGAVTVSGAGSTWTSSFALSVGNAGTGMLSIVNGGWVSASALDGGSAGSSVNLDGGTLRITGTDSATNTINLLAGGGTLEVTTSGTTFTLSTGLSGPGALTKTGAGTLTLTGTHAYAGATTIAGGTLQLGNGSTDGTLSASTVIAVNGGTLSFNNAGAQSFGGSISNSGSVTKLGAGSLALSGTFTRNAGAVLNVQGGVVTSTMTGLTANNAAGIIGTWASVGSGTSTRYATFSGGDIVALTGTAAATAANLTDTTGLVNYDLSNATGTLQATVSANTIRYTGGAATTMLGAAFSVNGLLNAGSTWTLASNTLTIGVDRELVVNAANNAITINSVIADNGGGASALTKTGAFSLTLRGMNTYSGATYLNQGTLNVNSSAALGDGSAGNTLVFNGGTLQAGQSFTSAATRGITLVTTGVVDTNSAVLTLGGVISGAGGLSKTGSGTLILTGANDYNGVTTVSAGTLSVATIGDGGVAGNLGAASSAAANLVLSNGTLQYTGVSASTDRSFTLSGSSYIEVTESATNLTLTGGSTGVGNLIKSGAGTLTLAGGNSATGATLVYAGTLVLDYTANNGSKLADGYYVYLYSATLQMDRTSGASGSHVEVVSGTLLYGGAYITRGSGSSAVLRMNNISRITGSTVDFSSVGIADTDTTNTNGILGNGWATIGGTDWAVNSTNGADGLISAYSAYTDVTRQSSGSKVIANNSVSNVRIVEGTGGSPASLTLGAATTTINTLNQSASGGTGAVVINLAGQILGVNGILMGSGSGALTIGTADANRGTLRTTVSNGELILQNFGGNGLTINAGIVNFSGANGLTHAGTGTTVLTGTNSYSGTTNVVGGTLVVSGGGRITATSALTLDGGALRVDGTTASSVSSTGNLIAGNYAVGTLSIVSGGTVSNASGFIGYNAGSMGVATVSGAGSSWTNTGNLFVGDRGNGTLSISSGGTVSNGTGYIGNNAGFMGTATVSGVGSTWTNTGNLHVGNGGTGTLSISSGGRVSNTLGILGDNAGAIGAATVSGVGSTWTSSNLYVGNAGVGTLSISSGGRVSDAIGHVGNNAGATGVVTVSGVGSTWTNSSDLYVGNLGAGTLSISSGGAVSNVRSYVGQNAGATGAVTVSGVGSTWTNSSDLYLGSLGVGTVSITDGGAVSNTGGYLGNSTGGAVTVGAGGGGTVTIGALGKLNVGTGGGAGTLSAATVTGSSGAVVNFNHTDNLTFAPGLAGSLSVNQMGSGTTTFATAKTYSGGTTVSAGTLNVTNSSGSATGTGAVTVGSAGTLSGTGIIATGANAITLDGALVIGSDSSAAATLTLGSTSGSGLTLGSGGSMRFDLFSGAGAGDNTMSLSASDLLILTGDVTILSGALLYIDNPNSMTNWAKGDMWKLWNVSGAGTITGSFSMASIIAPALSGELAWDFSSSTGILSIVPEPGRAMLLLLGLMAMVGRRRRCSVL